MLRKLFVVAAAIAMPVSVVAVTAGTAAAKKGPSPATDTATCHSLSGTVNFSPPLTNAGYTSGTETSTLSGTLTGCAAAGTSPVSLTSGSLTGTFSAKPGSAKHPSGTCTGLLGTTKQKGSISVAWSSSPSVAPTAIQVKTVTGGTSGSQATFSLGGKYKGSFGGADKGKSSSTSAQTVQTVATLAGECAGAGISSINIVGPSSGDAVTLG